MNERIATGDELEPITRRRALAWGGAAGAAALGSLLTTVPEDAAAAAGRATPGAANSVPTGTPVAMDPRVLELYMKLHAATADGVVPWYYTGRIYAVREGQAPQHLFNLEGTEIYWVRRTGEAAWSSLGSTLTFYRDIGSGAYFDEYRNPFTERVLPVTPNVLRSNAPTAFDLSGSGRPSGDKQPWVVESHRNADDVWLITSRYLLKMPQPWIEMQTMFGKAGELTNPKNTRASAMFSSSYLAPWLKWMDMGELKGHLLWHSSGRKLASYDEIPADYMTRAKRMQPGHFDAPAGA